MPDQSPMTGLAEWHQNNHAAVQQFQDPKNAGHGTLTLGHGTLTLGVSDLTSERARLAELKLEPSMIEEADYVRIIRLRDPDHNLVVLAEKK